MNKSELIDAIAASADIPKAVAGRALDAVIERYELELAALRASREAYVASKAAQAA